MLEKALLNGNARRRTTIRDRPVKFSTRKTEAADEVDGRTHLGPGRPTGAERDPEVVQGFAIDA